MISGILYSQESNFCTSVSVLNTSDKHICNILNIFMIGKVLDLPDLELIFGPIPDSK